MRSIVRVGQMKVGFLFFLLPLHNPWLTVVGIISLSPDRGGWLMKRANGEGSVRRSRRINQLMSDEMTRQRSEIQRREEKKQDAASNREEGRMEEGERRLLFR